MISTHQTERGRTQPWELPPFGDTDFSFPVEAKDCPKKRGDCPGKANTPDREAGTATEAGDDTGGGDILVCTTCRFPITRESERMEVNGSHTHGFANPHGLYYDIGCFAAALGCAFSQDSSSEFAWFVGHRWRLAVCRGCGTHMGWLFESKSGSFSGLILAALTLEQEGEEGQ